MNIEIQLSLFIVLFMSIPFEIKRLLFPFIFSAFLFSCQIRFENELKFGSRTNSCCKLLFSILPPGGQRIGKQVCVDRDAAGLPLAMRATRHAKWDVHRPRSCPSAAACV